MLRRILISMLAVFTAMALVPIGAASAGGNRLVAHLSGDNEVGAEGDPDGSGMARIRLRRVAKKVCWRLTWQNITTPQAAHIHKGERNENGPVVVNLFVMSQPGNEASGCEEGVSRRLIRRIKRTPRNFYVNIHTQDYPGGAIRGQLHRL